MMERTPPDWQEAQLVQSGDELHDVPPARLQAVAIPTQDEELMFTYIADTLHTELKRYAGGPCATNQQYRLQRACMETLPDR